MDNDSPNGIPPPNYTATPNVFFDKLLAQISSVAELKVTLAIMRKTFGWHKESDQLSVSQLQKLTGLSEQSVRNGLEAGIERGTITRTPSGQSFAYSLIIEAPDESEEVQDLDPPKTYTPLKVRPEGVQNLGGRGVQSLDPQKKVLQKKVKETASAQPTASQKAAKKSAGKPHKRDERSRDPRTNYPAIRLIKQLTGYNPKLILYDRVIEVLGDHPDFKRAEACAVEWAARGFRLDNHAWVFDWYVQGIPPKGNGAARHGPKQSNVDKSMEAVRSYIAEEQAKCQPKPM